MSWRVIACLQFKGQVHMLLRKWRGKGLGARLSSHCYWRLDVHWGGVTESDLSSPPQPVWRSCWDELGGVELSSTVRTDSEESFSDEVGGRKECTFVCVLRKEGEEWGKKWEGSEEGKFLPSPQSPLPSSLFSSFFHSLLLPPSIALSFPSSFSFHLSLFP